MILPGAIGRFKQVSEGIWMLSAPCARPFPGGTLASPGGCRMEEEVLSVRLMRGFLALALLLGVSAASAEETTIVVRAHPEPAVAAVIKEDCVYASSTKGPYYYQSTCELKARKLARGLANVTLCVAEIPNQMFIHAYKTSPVSGAICGIWDGVKKGGKRLAIGTWEIVTFYHPGSNYYQPYIEPEVVFGEYIH